MTMLLEAARPYERLDSFDKTIVNAQIKAFLAHIRKTCSKPTATSSSPPTCVQNGNGAQAEPEPPAIETPELDMSFLPKTESQKRTLQAAQISPDTMPRKRKNARGPDTAAYQAVMAAISSQKRALTGAEISAITGYNRSRTGQITSRMKKDGLLFVAGFKEGFNDWVALYHTDPNVKQSSTAAAIFAEKRVARLPPSLATMDHAQAIIKANFRTDSIAHRLYDVLAKYGPLTASQLSDRAKAHLTSVGTCLLKLQRLGLVQADTAIITGKGATPGLWDVKQQEP